MTKLLQESLGDRIRSARITAGMSLRDLAKALDKSPSYISDIENDRRVPAEQLLKDMSRLLHLEFDDLMAMAGRLGKATERKLRRSPALGMLLRTASSMTNEEIARLLSDVQSKIKPTD